MITNTSFERNIFIWYIKSLAADENISATNLKQVMNAKRTRGVMIRGVSVKKCYNGTLHLKVVIAILRMLFAFGTKDDTIIFQSGGKYCQNLSHQL